MQIDPLYTIPLVYNLTDPLDATVYFVRATIRDSLSGDVIEVVNLSSRGNGRYTGAVLAPKDPTGQGRHIDVVISVYTDAGYSTLSENYNRTIDKYLVKSTRILGGAGGADIDYSKIREILAKLLAPIAKQITDIEIPKAVKLDKVYKMGEKIMEAIDAIEPPQITTTNTDLAPVFQAISLLGVELSGKIGELPKKEAPDAVELAPVFEAIDAVAVKIGEVKSFTEEDRLSIVSALTEAFKGVLVAKEKDAEDQKLAEKAKELPPIISRYVVQPKAPAHFNKIIKK